MSTFKAEADAKALAVPATPDKYEVKLPEGFKPPEGMQFEFKTDDPAMIEARKTAHELGLDQAGFSRLLGVYAATRIAEQQATTTGRTAEMEKLGPTAQTRLENAETWLKARAGDKAGVFIATLKQYPVAANVEMIEGLMRAFSSQGGASFTGSHREGADDQGKIPGYENMTFEQKRHAQEQQRARRTA